MYKIEKLIMLISKLFFSLIIFVYIGTALKVHLLKKWKKLSKTDNISMPCQKTSIHRQAWQLNNYNDVYNLDRYLKFRHNSLQKFTDRKDSKN
ncbi:hypothetical protein BpHYR1_024581 [Brachionus plicatilis]|uniref:Uncharacterized protein n=1 Tax=Brachionus plicatilis TaxID=10195 RepID=A0A3M7R150_BRAPC|nr:hypothetical protein BpHYR1_024581 [Brachionus plicatilis]